MQTSRPGGHSSDCWMIESNLFFNSFAARVMQSGRFAGSERLLEPLLDGRNGKELPPVTSAAAT